MITDNSSGVDNNNNGVNDDSGVDHDDNEVDDNNGVNNGVDVDSEVNW